MLAQNEPPETVVRLVRGDDRGRADRHPRRVPRREGRRAGARRGADLAAEPRLAARRALRRRAGGRADARSLRRAGRQGDDARRRGDRGRAASRPRARARGERAAARRDERHGRLRRRARRCPPELDGFDRALVDAPCSGLGTLASRPDLRWRAEPLPELQLALVRAAAERVRPGGTVLYSVCTIDAAENEAVVDASGPDGRAARRGVARVPASAPAGVPAHAAAPRRHVGLLRRPTQGLGSLQVPWDDWIRTVEIEPSIYAADFANLGEQIEALLRTGARIFHFDVGDGHFVPPITMGPIVLQSIAPQVHAARRRARLPSDGRRARASTSPRSPRRAATASPSTSRPSSTCAGDDPRGPRAGAPGRDRVQPGDGAGGGRGGRGRRRPRPLHEHPSRLLRPGVHARGARADRAAARGAAAGGARAGGRRHRPENVLSVYEAGADLIVSGSSIFSREDLPRAYRRLVHALAGPPE